MAELTWFEHRDSGGKHGFTLPLHEDIEQQVRKGMLRPCPAPDPGAVRSLILTPEQERQLAGADLKESKAEKKARLLAALAELGDDEDDEPDTDVAVSEGAVAGDPSDTPTRARTAAKKPQQGR